MPSEIGRVEGPDHAGVGPVDGEGFRGAPMLAERLADLRRPAGRRLLRVVRDQHVVEGDRWSDLAHALDTGARVPPGREVEEHRRAVREREVHPDEEEIRASRPFAVVAVQEHPLFQTENTQNTPLFKE